MPEYEVFLRRDAEEQLSQVQPSASRAVRDAISGLIYNPKPDGAVRLSDDLLMSYMAVHAQNYCIEYTVFDAEVSVQVTRIAALREDSPHCRCEPAPRRKRFWAR